MRRTFRIVLPVAVFVLLAYWVWDGLFVAGRTIVLRNVGAADIDSVVLRIERLEHEIIDRPASPTWPYTVVNYSEWDAYHLGTIEPGEEDGLDLLRDSFMQELKIEFYSGGKRKELSTYLNFVNGDDCSVLIDVDGAADEVRAIDWFHQRNTR